MKKVCIIGLGYVGLPLAELCLKKGYAVFGYDSSKEKIELLKKGVIPFKDVKNLNGIIFSDDEKIISEAEILIVCVSTPINSKKCPDLDPIISAIVAIKNNMRLKSLIIIESTINPGLIDDVLKPILEEQYADGIDYYLSHCPERINPGDPKWNVENLPRVLGSTTKEGLEKSYEFYKSVVNAEIKKMSSIKAAEAVKIVENSFRDVNIAFVNELAKSFDLMGIDILEVLNGAATKPFAFLLHYPGCGVGGHCIAVDPYYLIEKAKDNGFDHKFLRLAREINDSMPDYTVQIIMDELNKIELPIKNTTIGILGVAYKGGVGDVRESPASIIINKLKDKGAVLKIYDPYVSDKTNSELSEVLNCECVVLLTNHPEFKNLDYSKAKIVIDGKNFLDKNKIKNYKGIGR